MDKGSSWLLLPLAGFPYGNKQGKTECFTLVIYRNKIIEISYEIKESITVIFIKLKSKERRFLSKDQINCTIKYFRFGYYMATIQYFIGQFFSFGFKPYITNLLFSKNHCDTLGLPIHAALEGRKSFRKLNEM